MASKSYQIKLILVLFTCMFVMGIDRSSLGVAAPLIMKAFKIGPGAMGIALSAFFWAYALFNLPAGNLADRFGSKGVLFWAAVLWSLASAATGMTGGLISLIAARFFVGVGEAGVWPITGKIAAENFIAKERGTAVGVYQSGARLGYAATPIIMGFLIARYSWRWAFIVTGVGSLLWCVLWYCWNRGAGPSGQGTQISAKPKIVIPWKQLLTNRCTLGLFFAKFCGDYLYFMFLTWVPSYLVMERGFSILKMGIYASLPFFTAFLTQPLVGIFSDWLVKKGCSLTVARKGVLIGAQICASSIMVVGFVDSPMVAVAILTLNMAAASTTGSLTWVLCTDVAPEGMAGTLGGGMNAVSSTGGILAPAITGFIVKITGSFQLALAVGGILLVLAACTVLFVIPSIKPIELKAEA
jgi:ACS family glucarate transporter-like MFS transporter